MQAESLRLAEQSFGDCKVFKLMLQEDELRGIETLKSVGYELYAESAPETVFSREPRLSEWKMSREHGFLLSNFRMCPKKKLTYPRTEKI